MSNRGPSSRERLCRRAELSSRFQSLAGLRRIRLASSGIKTSIAALLFLALAAPALAADLPDGFVRLAEIDPAIGQDMRYAGPDNFTGRPVSGYEAPVCILTKQAAQALSRARVALGQKGMMLVVFDCYRPARAVTDLVDWSRTKGPPDPRWFPRVRREELVEKGYVGLQSNHSRGSTIDLTLAPLGKPDAVTAGCGALATGALDMGSGFDCFDPVSATASPDVSAQARANRALLFDAMKAAGFRNYAGEWWHFALKGESLPKQRFDFPVR